MNRKRTMVAVGAAAGAAVAVFVFIQRRHEAKRQTPDWKDPGQPIDGTGGMPSDGVALLAPSPAAAWNAVRPGSPRMGAGSVIMRSYSGSLLDDPESLVR